MSAYDRVTNFNQIIATTLELSNKHWAEHGEPIPPDQVARVAMEVAIAVGDTVFTRREPDAADIESTVLRQRPTFPAPTESEE
jgi:hypothetical protein